MQTHTQSSPCSLWNPHRVWVAADREWWRERLKPTTRALVLLHLTCPAFPLALLSAVRINGDGQEVLYLAEGDSVKLGCPYILDPEDYGPSGLDIEWMQVNSDPSHRENVVSARNIVPLT